MGLGVLVTVADGDSSGVRVAVAILVAIGGTIVSVGAGDAMVATVAVLCSSEGLQADNIKTEIKTEIKPILLIILNLCCAPGCGLIGAFLRKSC